MAQESVGAGGMPLRSSTKLGPTQDKKEVVRRMTEMRKFTATEENEMDFNPDTFATQAVDHIAQYSIGTFGAGQQARLEVLGCLLLYSEHEEGNKTGGYEGDLGCHECSGGCGHLK